MSQEKTEKATPRKKDDSRKKGQVAKSGDIPTAIITIFVFGSFFILGGYIIKGMLSMMKHSFIEYMLWDLTEKQVPILFRELTIEAAKLVIPVMLVSVIAAFLANYIQVGFLFTTKPLEPKLDKINPIQGAKKIVSIRALVELFKSILKVTSIGTVVWIFLKSNIQNITKLSATSPFEAGLFIMGLILKMGLTAGFTLLILGVLDYMYQKYDYEKNLRMSKQDIKDEYKKSEGDPFIKGKRKEKARQMSMNRMMQAVKEADVVIVNPTHYAIAISYKQGEMTAPTIVAKAQDYTALKVREIAEENDIPIIQNIPLARGLYEVADIGDEVPEEFFNAIAEVLAHVYSLKK